MKRHPIRRGPLLGVGGVQRVPPPLEGDFPRPGAPMALLVHGAVALVDRRGRSLRWLLRGVAVTGEALQKFGTKPLAALPRISGA